MRVETFSGHSLPLLWDNLSGTLGVGGVRERDCDVTEILKKSVAPVYVLYKGTIYRLLRIFTGGYLLESSSVPQDSRALPAPCMGR